MPQCPYLTLGGFPPNLTQIRHVKHNAANSQVSSIPISQRLCLHGTKWSPDLVVTWW